MNLSEIARGALADSAEKIARHRRRMAIIQVLFGYPFMGALYGTMANLVAWVACLAPTPWEFIIAAALAALVPIAYDRHIQDMEPAIGDATNRGLTRTFGIPWIASHRRPPTTWNGEPWRTSIIVTIIIATAANSASTSDILVLLAGNTWITAAVVGSLVATIRGAVMRQTWDGLLRRGVIQT